MTAMTGEDHEASVAGGAEGLGGTAPSGGGSVRNQEALASRRS
jgi:hypothetical protein